MQPAPEPATLVLSGPQTLTQIVGTHATLVAALAGERPMTLDCAAVTSVDVSFVQLLIAARRSAGAAGKRFAVAGPPGREMLAALAQGGFLGEADDEPPLQGQGAETA